MKFIVNGLEVEFTACTAISASIGDTERQNALFVHDCDDEFGNGDSVIFGVDMPETDEEAAALMCEPADSYQETLDTVSFNSRNALRGVRREWPSGADDGRPKGVNEMTREERAEKKRIVQSLGEAFSALPEAKREFLIGYAEGVAAMKAKMEQTEEKKAG